MPIAGLSVSGFCTVTYAYTNYGVLGSSVTVGSTGSCAFCDASTETVFPVPVNGVAGTFICDTQGTRNAIVCLSSGPCQQSSGPNYKATTRPYLTTDTYPNNPPGSRTYTRTVTGVRLETSGVAAAVAVTSTPAVGSVRPSSVSSVAASSTSRSASNSSASPLGSRKNVGKAYIILLGVSTALWINIFSA